MTVWLNVLLTLFGYQFVACANLQIQSESLTQKYSFLLSSCGPRLGTISCKDSIITPVKRHYEMLLSILDVKFIYMVPLCESII